MAIPDFNRITGLLPEGEHPATWSEVANKFGGSPTRNALLEGLLKACYALRNANVKFLLLDGSFVTNKRNPGDWDACYSGVGVESKLLDPVFRDFSNNRKAQKDKYKGESFIAEMPATGNVLKPYRKFFQTCKKTGKPKGIINLDLSTLP